MSEPSCDIVVPVHNALDAADDCLRSVLAYTRPLAQLIVVDDASDPHVAEQLDALAREDIRVRVIRHERNLGFVHSVNDGLAETTAPFVCLLNSDTVVTPGWMEAMLRCAQSDERIAIVNPISNAAVNLTVQMAPGLDVFSMALAVANNSRQSDPDVVTAVGFCFLITRAAIERFGGFDEAYGHGYCEESDYCMRVTGADLRVVVADDAFVYHRGGGTFGRSRERYVQNRRLFDQRWRARYESEYDEFLRRDPLRYLRTALARDLVEPSPIRNVRRDGVLSPPRRRSAHTGPVQKLWAMTADAWSKGGMAELARKTSTVPRHIYHAARHLLRGPGNPHALSDRTFADPEERPTLFATPAYTERLPRGRGLRIGVLVWAFEVCGGIVVIVDLINQLVLAGHTVIVATLDDRGMDAAFTLYARPLVFESAADLAEGFPDVDVVLATFWPTATEWVPAIRRRRPHASIVYFLQDYEPWFVPENDTALRARIVGSYGLADIRIVTSPWLRDKLSEHGHDSTVVPIGIDPRVFYPQRRHGIAVRKRILVQARPANPWRGFATALQVCTVLAGRRDDIEIVLFGCHDADLAKYSIRFPHRNEGVVTDRAEVARLYASCDVLFDPSHFQAFGLPGLEAMACGTPTVLPDRGGILQYAEHERNTLLVEPGDTGGCAAAIERLLDDDALRARLISAGVATASRFAIGDMARRHLEMYREGITVHPSS